MTAPDAGARILAVEDNPANLELMSYLLRARGHDVVEAPTAQAALDAATGMRPDLMVIDIQLPDATGYELLDRLRAEEHLAGVPAVAVTAYAMREDRTRVLAAGFDAYLVKPIDPPSFADTIEALLAGLTLPEPRDPGAGPDVLSSMEGQ